MLLISWSIRYNKRRSIVLKMETNLLEGLLFCHARSYLQHNPLVLLVQVLHYLRSCFVIFLNHCDQARLNVCVLE
jgi:hypothetical protein